MIFQETSAKSDIGIKDLFNAIAKRVYELNITIDGKGK
jgi:hypothetical protein